MPHSAMAVQHKRVVGRQEFGSYPLIRLRPPPEISIAAYVKSALEDERHLGTRAKFPRRNCVRADGQKFVFYDNFLARSRLAPLFEPSVDFQRYTSCHDDWLFHFRDNLRLHNEVKRFELRQAGDVARRLELGGGEDRVCSNYRYSRRRGREAKEGAEPAAEPKWVLCGKKVFADYPANVDLLPPVAPRRPRPEPEHVGWTHSDEAGSWFLEAKTPSAYDDHAAFLKKCYSERVVRPMTNDGPW